MIRDIKDQNLKLSALAVLIDGDNTSYRCLNEIFNEVSKYGIATIRRAYGDWTSQELAPWKEFLQEYAVHPSQQFRNVGSKNCTDSSLIIEAMDILYNEKIDGIVIVSSDSDYTRLATRYREEGLFVLGVGRKQTPKPFVNACIEFVYIENLTDQDLPDVKNKEIVATKNSHSIKARKILGGAYDKISESNELVLLSKISNMLHNMNPDFDPRTHGYSKLSKMVEDSDVFELVRKKNNIYMRRVTA
ncbi:NYN domain-containing protein [Methanolobus vulcani]|uniref:NYN domain-containing protein n=1 Tax=Methanolobus vulcani TaxID=38026 RepID=A0A7Z8KLP9_9EURY|nr:NYN domain-containing protein [Methanolobus vulcani]TQD23564.1 NYN domain-containing protein [Methanolobus vulcani]